MDLATLLGRPVPISEVEAGVRNKLGAEPAQDQRWDWVKRGDYPTLAAFLQNALASFGGVRAGAAGPLVRDIGMAARLERSAPASDPGITGGMRLNPESDALGYMPNRRQPVSYPDYDYQVFGDKGRWMNDARPGLPTRSYEGQSPGMARVFNEAVLDPPGYGAQPGLPQYPRIPSHWVPENNPAKHTLYGPRGITDRATFTADTLDEMLRQIARTELKPSERAYLEAMARQKFAQPSGSVVPFRRPDND